MRGELLTALTTTALLAAGCTGGADDPGTGDDAAAPTEDASVATTAPASPEATPSATASATTAPATDADSSPSDDNADGTLAMSDCTADRYAVPAPPDWDVNDPDGPLDACRIFHPEDVEVPDEAQGIDLHWAAAIRIDAVAFEDLVDADVQGEVLVEERTTVDGRDALVRETRSDGSGMVPQGETTYLHAVDLGDGETLVATTFTVGETDYERDKDVLDRMMDGLTLTG